MFCTFLYADDAANFLAPICEDVASLAHIVNSFGDATGLDTNFAKILVAPIWCDNTDLASVLHDLPAATTCFLMRYLGLPPAVKKLKRVHFQYLEDKAAAAKLTPWAGRCFNIAGRKTLAKSVLTSQVTYPLTVLVIPAETMHAIMKIIRSFL